MAKTRRHFTSEFKQEAAGLVLDQSYSIKEACEAMGVGLTAMRRWVKQLQAERNGETPTGSKALTKAQQHIQSLQSQIKQIEREKEILKNCLHSTMPHLMRNTILDSVRKVVECLLETSNPVKKPDPGGSADPMLVALIDPV